MKYNTIFLALVLSLSISSPIELNANSYFKNGVDMLYSSFKNLSQYMPNILRTLTPENVTLFTVAIGTLGTLAYQSYQSSMLKRFLNTIRPSQNQTVKNLEQFTQIKDPGLQAEKLKDLYHSLNQQHTNPHSNIFFENPSSQ